MRLSSTNMQDRKMLFAAIPSICASSPKKILIYNEEMIVACCFLGFLIFSRKSLGKTFKETLDGRIKSIQEELQQFSNPNEVMILESNEQQRLLRTSLRICGTVVEYLKGLDRSPKCEKTVQALLCRNLNVKSATLLNATSSRRIRLQDDIVTGFHNSVSERFVPGCTLKASIVELIREGLVVLRKVGNNLFLISQAPGRYSFLPSTRYFSQGSLDSSWGSWPYILLVTWLVCLPWPSALLGALRESPYDNFSSFSFHFSSSTGSRTILLKNKKQNLDQIMILVSIYPSCLTGLWTTNGAEGGAGSKRPILILSTRPVWPNRSSKVRDRNFELQAFLIHGKLVPFAWSSPIPAIWISLQ